jgi:hypothetical protein
MQRGLQLMLLVLCQGSDRILFSLNPFNKNIFVTSSAN